VLKKSLRLAGEIRQKHVRRTLSAHALLDSHCRRPAGKNSGRDTRKEQSAFHAVLLSWSRMCQRGESAGLGILSRLFAQGGAMRSRTLVLLVMSSSFFLGWGAHVLAGQRHTPVSVIRLYTGSDGETHAEQITDTILTSDPARGGLEVSEPIKVTSLQFVRTSPGWVRDWHAGERHQYIITLSGKGEIEVSGGRKFALDPGTVILEEDSTGKGHISRTTGTEDRIALNVQLAPR
jgi:hypothetical protein